MSRQLRIEYPGAVYHIQSNGNRGGKIFETTRDYETFLATLGQTARRCSWCIYAYALMKDHYHLLLETKEPNLADGMKWLQTTYTMRFHAANKTMGHLFSGRYHSMLVEATNAHYLSTTVDYIHLNPARAGLTRRAGLLEGSLWTSIAAWISPPEQRPEWMSPERGLHCFGCTDTDAGHQKYLDHIMGLFEAERMDEKSLIPVGHVGPGTAQRGWCYGSKAFRQRILRDLPNLTRRPNTGSLGKQGFEVAEMVAERIAVKGFKAFGLSEDDLLKAPFSLREKCVIALAIHQNTIVPYAWISQRLHMGKAGSLGTLLTRAKKYAKEDPKVEAWIAKISQ